MVPGGVPEVGEAVEGQGESGVEPDQAHEPILHHKQHFQPRQSVRREDAHHADQRRAHGDSNGDEVNSSTKAVFCVGVVVDEERIAVDGELPLEVQGGCESRIVDRGGLKQQFEGSLVNILVKGKCDLKLSISEGEGGFQEVGVVEGEEHFGVDRLEDMQVDGRGELHRHLILE